MVVRHNQTISEIFDLPAGGCQGTNLGILNFLVTVNSCGVPMKDIFNCFCDSHSGDLCHPVLPTPAAHIEKDTARFKYVDDLTHAEAIKMSDLEPIDWDMQRPLQFRDRTLQYLPGHKSHLQETLLDLDRYCDIQQMVLNTKKTFTALFHTKKTKDFLPRFVNSSGTVYNNEEEFKLLGVDFVSNARAGLSWDKYLKKCIGKAFAKMWILRRLVELGVSHEHLILTYVTRIRCYLEFNVPLWSFSASQIILKKIEKVQRIAVFIILGKEAHRDYLCNLAILDLEPLAYRRDLICQNIAKKIFRHPTHRNMFQLAPKTRSEKLVIEPHSKTKRYERSAIPSLAKILNSLN